MTIGCSECGGTETRAIKQIELWAKGHETPAIMQLHHSGSLVGACTHCRPTALSVVRDFRRPLLVLAHLPWSSAYLRYHDGTISDRMTRAEIEA